MPTGSLPGLGSGRIWEVAFAPSDPSLAAAATDNGVYISVDGGLNWTQSGLRGVGVWAVAFSPSTNAPSIYAGLQKNGGVRVSSDEGQSWTNQSSGLPNLDVRCIAVSSVGIAVGTDDGVALSTNGTTWTAEGLSGDSVSAVAMIASPPSVVVYAGIDYPSTTHGFLFRFDPSQGAGWSPITTDLPHPPVIVNSISLGPTSASVSNNPILVATSGGAYWSTDGGTSWSASQGLASTATVTDAAYSPLDPNLVYAGSDSGGSSGGGLWRSTDGGQTFQTFISGLPTSHAKTQYPLQEVESLAVASGSPYPTVLAAVDPYNQNAQIYRQVDSTAPSPPAGGATASPSGTLSPLPVSASATATPATAASNGGTNHGPTPSTTPLAAQVAGAVFHFPIPLVFEILFVLLVVFLLIRWRRHYYVEGPP